MGKFHKLALNFKDCTFGVIVTRRFRPISSCLNERAYCKAIDRKLKMLFIEGLGNFLQPTVLSYGSYWFLDKKETNITRL